MENENTCQLENNENQCLTPQKEWHTPELFKIPCDETLATAYSGIDTLGLS